MITQKLFEKINQALDDRVDWEQKQLDWHRLRYEGYERPRLPYPGAPDMHYPLVDIEIGKLTPFYIQQIYGQERLASFIDTNIGQDASHEGVNATIQEDELRFDVELKQRSNFESSSHTFVDKMLHYGVCVVKTIWKDNQVQFVPIDAMRIIVPIHTPCLEDADEWIVHILRMSEAQYRANPKFVKTDDVINRIKGRGASTKGSDDQRQQQVDIREGITGSENDDVIVLWEVYHKANPGDKQWTISTVSPLAGVDTEIAKDVKLPYNRGGFAEGAHPFTEFTYEAATEGFYSPRGIAEILEPFELDLCKSWNYKLQFLDFNGQPTFYVDDPTANLFNFSNEPGSCRPFGIKRDEPLEAPIDLDKAMQLSRALAEDRVAVPDLGNAMHLDGKQGQKGQVTATQIRAIVGLSNQSNDLRSKLFKGQLAILFGKAWDLICQYRNIDAKKSLIVPSGSADAWNKEARAQKMLALFQVLSGRPNVDQDELVKIVLEQDSPELVKRLFRSSGLNARDNATRQAEEFVIMLNGYTPDVDPQDDDATHLQVLAQMAERRLQKGEPVDPELATRVLAHGARHEQQLQQKKDPRLEQILAQLAPLLAILKQIASAGPQPPPPAPAGTPDGTPFSPAPTESNNEIPF